MATIPHVPTQPDPILAAIAAHRAAYDAYQVAPEGKASLIANDDYDAASDALVSTPCSTRFGALALLEHLRWWLADEAEYKDGHQPAYGIAEARAADLALFLGTAPTSMVAIPGSAADVLAAFLPTRVPSRRSGSELDRQTVDRAPVRLLPACDRYRHDAPSGLLNEALPGEGDAWEAVAPLRPDTEHVRAPRFIDRLGEALAALALLGGGAVLTGFASLL